jgi:hypothetical protein
VSIRKTLTGLTGSSTTSGIRKSASDEYGPSDLIQAVIRKRSETRASQRTNGRSSTTVMASTSK